MPVLLYGCENWILTEVLWEKLEAFQGELAKRILKWPKHHSNTAAATTLEVSTMRCRVLIRKLSFLQHVVNSNSASLSGTALLALSDDTASICLVRECRELEEVFGTHFTQEILSDNAPPLREVKDAIHERDRTKLTAKCSEKAPMIAAVARRITWSRLWDSALDLGDKSVKGLQYLSRAMSHHGCGNHPCPLQPLFQPQSLTTSWTVTVPVFSSTPPRAAMVSLISYNNSISVFCVTLASTVVVLCVCLSTTILALQAMRRLMSDTNSFSATRARKTTWRFC